MAEAFANDGTSDFNSLNPTEKAAILMMGLGEDAAGEVIRYLPPDKIIALSRAMEKTTVVRREELAKVSEEMLISCDATDMLAGSDYITRTLQQALGQERAQSLMKLSSSLANNPILEHLLWLDTNDILAMIRNEKPQLQAVVLACLSPEKGSAVLGMLPEQSRPDLANRLARLQDIPASSLDTVADLIANFEYTGSDVQSVHGAGLLAEMLNHMDDSLGNTLLDSIRDKDTALGHEIDELRLNFDHLLQLDATNLAILIEAVPQDVLALSLKGVNDIQLEHVLAGMSKRASGYLREELNTMGSVRASAVREARQKIVSQARTMEIEGKIELRSNDEMVP